MNVIIIQSSFLLGSLCNNDGEVQLENVTSVKSEFALLQTLSCLFQLVQFVKCWQILPLKAVLKLRKRKKKSMSSFTPAKKREIRHFHVVVVQRRQRNVQKSVMHLQSCWFANLLLLFCRSLCRCHRCRRRRSLSSLFLDGNTLSYVRSRHSTTVSSLVKTLQILSELSRVLLYR